MYFKGGLFSLPHPFNKTSIHSVSHSGPGRSKRLDVGSPHVTTDLHTDNFRGGTLFQVIHHFQSQH